MSERKTRNSFAATVPPFIDYLKDILRRYPDGGQILKELIQNADDAGASEVVFLHDERCYGSQSLKTEGLGKYQGPALYAFNNAEFTAEDWEGITTTGRSIKRKDPNKVGRFGIGFNSVYHMTDVPSIFSSKYLGFLDAQDKLFEEDGGFRWCLENEEDQITLLNLQDQFQPFRDVVELVSGQRWKDIIQEEQHFKGTLFRFPLRSEASEISDNLYDYHKVVQLFESFIADADIIPLFLRNVSSVSLQHINTNGSVNTRLSVTSSSPTADPSLKPRSDSNIKGSTCFKTIASTSNKEETKTRWLVTTCCMKDGNVPKLDSLAKKLSFRPHVDLAFPCGQENVLTEGRLSCFLPLPNNDSNKTGLPVHVNACFGLTDNRRHIKWQEEDQKYDEAAMWNELLVKEVLPHTYLLMLQDAINLAKTTTLPVSAVYKIWPDLSQTRDKWHGIAEDILQRLFRQNTAVFSLAEDERQFVSLAESVCPSNDPKASEMMAAVTRTLIAGGEKLVTFPDHVSRAVQQAFPNRDTLKWVTPALVRGVLRRDAMSNLSIDDKRSLLQFILSDEKYHNLRDLKMLPLSDGTFKTFTNEEKDIALIDNDSFPRVLLPGYKALFLPDDLSDTSIHHLRQLAKTKKFNVFNVDADIVATFAKKSLPKDWEQTDGHVTWKVGSGQHPPLRWLREFWKCLNTHWEYLRCFEGMPLIPIEPLHDTSQSVKLARLQQNPTILFRESKQTILSDKIENVINSVGGTVVNRDKCLKHRDLDSYVLPLSPQNILQVFMNLAASQVISGISSAPHHEKEELKAYLSTLNPLTVQERDLLSKMPLFQSMAGEYVAALSKQAVVLSSTPALPTELPMLHSIVRCATEADRKLLLLLEVDLLETAQAAIYLVDGVERKSFKKQETERIMTWILQHGSILFLQNGTLYRKCKDLSFIEVDGKLKKTSSIFDPNNKTFQVLFEEDFFPPAVFTQTPEMLDGLTRIGLQTKEMEVSADNVLHIAIHIEKSRVHSQRAFKKAEALQRLLNDNDLLSQFSHQQLQHLSQLQWVPCENPCITKEKNKRKSFYKPEEIRHSEYKSIVGHVMPLTADFSQKVSRKLGLLRLPPAEKVMENVSSLAAVAQAMTDPDKDVEFKTKLHNIYKYMQDHIPAVREVLNKRCIPWLWIHNHFVFPHDVVLAYPPDLDLSLYIERVTDEFLPYSTLLTEFRVKTSLSKTEIEDILYDIKQTIEERSQPFGEPSELKVSIAILNWMWREKKTVKVNIPVPVMAGSQRFTLQPLSKTVFCDISRISLEDIQHDQEEMHVIHEEISPATAKWLNIPFLSTRILCPELIGIEQCGQSEPITLRIKNILKEYDEVNDIFKELIQNAEDAGANTCKFMVDFRDHKDPADSLIDQGMSLCQGPCLWAFNDELFTEDDWKNIVKLGSASKENKVEKIGKFGLGFNAVYHVTDIPSILSGKGLLILDPNVTHLQKHIQNKANTGIKLDLSREQVLHRFPGQFRPYERIFDCNLSKKSTQKFYQGTLIKLPFRTREEAVKSEISGNVYDSDGIVKFQKKLINSQTHLLFLKNIKMVSLQNLPSDASTPPQDDQIETLFTATRKVVSTFKIPEDTPPGTMQNDALKSLMKQYAKCQEVIDCHSANIAELTQQHCDGSDVQFWLLYNCFGTQNSLQMVQTDNKHTVFSLPIGGVAVPLNKEPQTGKWVPGDTKQVGQAFSFLPLSVATGLPVNLNGSFAVTSNRRGLWESGVKYDWNRALLQDAVTTAYVTTLLVLKNMSKNGDLQRYQYYTFWPNEKNVSKTFKPLVDAFYFAITQHFSGKALELFSDGDNWCSMCNARFLHPTIQEDKVVGELAMKVCQRYPNASYHVVPLPSWVRQSFIQTGFETILNQRTFDWETFYQNVVFNNLSTMDQKSRNTLVLHAIDLNGDAIDNLLRSYPCIPTKKSGQLQFIKKLVNPLGKVACLFEQEEGRFLGGTKNDFCSSKRIQRLSELGMLSNHLPLEDITERAETIASIWQKEKGKAYKHLQCILELMRDSLEDKASPHWETLRNTEFIPACAPVNTWEGKDGAVRLQKPTDIYSDRCRLLVDMTQSVVDSSNLKIHSDDAVLRILGLCESPSLETVLQQLQEASKHTQTFDKQMLFNIALECYRFLNEWLQDEKESTAIFERAHSFPFILVEDRFVDVKSVAKIENFEAKPYLHVLPPSLSSFKELWKCLGIQKQFTSEQFHGVLQKLSQAYGISPLSNNDLEICLTIILRGLYKAKDENQKDGLIPDENQDDCLIPDGSGVLKPSNQLYFNDSPWMEVSENVTLCHKKISRAIALYFGVNTTRHHTLQKHSVENFSPFAEEFGQHEELTVRIKNIIAAYPSKKDILKELIQNADDAEATEIHFVLDKRNHSTERTFGERWHPLQGPALCVYNNQVFSEADLRGIQQLGEGGKHNIPGKTGKYGLGFNSVYHLTDCPSILTGDKWLCISDPNLKYVEGGSRESPGRKYTLKNELKNTFMDVYNTFLPNEFSLEKGTMFRLPIRSCAMAKTSKISSNVVNDRDINELSSALREDPEGLILFLKNIRKIQFHEINTNTGTLRMTFSIEKSISEKSHAEKVYFQNHVQQSLLSDGPTTPHEAIYNVKISSSDERQSQWIIAEQFGSFKGNTDMKGETGRVPQASLAACVSSHSKQDDFSGQVFCSLPLPGRTGLPVHVNGHFQVDSSRRALWKEDGKSLKTDWNESLKRNIIAPLYAGLLNYICNLNKVKPNSIHLINSVLDRSYLSFFPTITKDIGQDWHEMIHEVYRSVNEKELCVVPILRRSTCQVQPQSMTHLTNVKEYTVDWSSVRKTVPTDTPHLTSMENSILFSILEDIGMQLVPSSTKMTKIWTCFETAGIDVERVSPLTVGNYLRKKPLNDPTQTEMGLPLPIGQTLIKDKERCSKLLEYCIEDVVVSKNTSSSESGLQIAANKKHSRSVSGLPLLLTQDQILRVFDPESPKLLSTFSGLFHGHQEDFADYTTNINHVEVLEDGNFLEKLTIPVTVKYLKPILLQLLQNCETDPHSRLHVPDETMLSWLKALWKFFDGQVKLAAKKGEGDNQALRAIKELFSDCPILPVVCPRLNKHVLQTMRKMSSVIDVESKEDMSSILLKLGLMKINIKFFRHVDQLLYQHLLPELLKTSDCSAVLDQVHQLKHSEFRHLSSNELIKLLQFLQSGMCSSKNRQGYQRKLKSLPLFETIQGKRQRIDGQPNVFILKTEFKESFPDLYMADDNNIFLKYNCENESLSENLSIKILSDLEYYVQFILPFLHKLNENQMILSVQLLLLLQLKPNYKYHEKIISTMKNVKFIRNINGNLQMASYYFDKNEKLYEVMLPQERFVPESFWKIFPDGGIISHKVQARKLLEELEMKCTVSDEEIIEFAHKIELDAKVTANLQELKLKSSTLFETILKRDDVKLAPNFLKIISDIKFVFPVEIQKRLCSYHPSFAGERTVVSIRGCLLGKDLHKSLIWTTMPILHLRRFIEKHITMMIEAGAVEQPPPERVIENLRNICQSPCQTPDLVGTRAEVFRTSYTYLQTIEFDPKLLSDLPVVLVEEDSTLVKTKQTALVLPHDVKFRPYLYCIPPKDVRYAEFFKKIGVKDEPTAEQYCNVLQEIHADSTDKQTLQPNQEETVKCAVEQLFCLIRKLEENHLTSELPKALYLPSTDGRLYPSDSLYFNDTVFQGSRLEGALKDLKLLEKLSNYHLGFDRYGHHKMLQLLPLEIRPKMLSQTVVENMVESNMQLCEYGECCEFSGWFQAHLSSTPFRHGLVCLIRQQKEGQVSQGDAATMCETAFGSIEITCCKSLETVLWLGQELLSGTTAATQLYVKKGQQGCTFYLKHNNDTAHKVKSEVIMRLTYEINVLLNNILGSNLLLVLGHLLSCDSMEDVKMALEQNGIHNSADTGSTNTEESLKGPPEPGSPIPEEWHDTLDMSYLNNYEAGEYVGYKKTAEEDYWCYAVIVEQLCVPTGQSGQSAHRYKIQIGKDKVILVSALDLYQFKQEKKPSSIGATCMELVQLTESVPRSSTTMVLPQSLEEAKKDIEDCLAEIWTLSAEEKHKAINRLWLRWHPDKNPDCLQLATEAFKYLQNRIEDLENSRTGNQSSPQWNTNFRNFYEQWNQEAHRHRCGRERFSRERGHNTRYNFYTYHGNVPQPNRAEAQRWLSQAQCDLAAAHNDTGGRATEWTLFKVHQAVEKALIAAEYRRHGQYSSNISISILAERVSDYSPKLHTLPSIVSKLKQLGVDAKTTQYPNYHPLPNIPNKMFKCENETEVLDMASKLLCKIEMYVH
ncbi:sacsin isoform X1 [Oncorhynchus mykiss]|uniref:HEPN domain-containing protein n=3 Tax=Oncorhynchus mykiss TaxID=8022 RepID=A0A8C7PEJ4_ONCMY|nr:sacsin isoform X1 [Oncorhynchus mykiss]